MAGMQEQQGEQQQLQQQGSDPVSAVRVSAAVRAAAAASAASHAGGGVNVLLRYPVVVGHEITADSPLKEWITHDGMLKVSKFDCIPPHFSLQTASALEHFCCALRILLHGRPVMRSFRHKS